MYCFNRFQPTVASDGLKNKPQSILSIMVVNQDWTLKGLVGSRDAAARTKQRSRLQPDRTDLPGQVRNLCGQSRPVWTVRTMLRTVE